MKLTRNAGIGLAILLGLVTAAPVLADDAAQSALSTIDKATATLNDMQALGKSLEARQSGGGATAAVAAPTEGTQAAASTETRSAKKGKGAKKGGGAKGKGGKKKKNNPQ